MIILPKPQKIVKRFFHIPLFLRLSGESRNPDWFRPLNNLAGGRQGFAARTPGPALWRSVQAVSAGCGTRPKGNAFGLEHTVLAVPEGFAPTAWPKAGRACAGKSPPPPCPPSAVANDYLSPPLKIQPSPPHWSQPALSEFRGKPFLACFQ